MPDRELIQRKIEESIRVKQQFSDELLSDIELAAQKIISSYRNGGKLLLFGNGGSAADAQHIACELVGRFLMERRPLSAIALNTNASVLTCLGNDYGYEQIFRRQVEAMARPEDVVFAISTSGNSANIISAVEAAKTIGSATIGMTGLSGGQMKGLVDVLLNVPSTEAPRIQESHILIGHIICELVERSVQEK
jgi:D-sedoheptulose 7-phosphate isomerase